MRQRNLCLAWFVLHFLLIIIASCRDLFRLVADGLTILPSSFSIAAQHVETIASSALSRRCIATYLHAAGIQAGYTFFAPNVPGYHRLTLELFYNDGRVEHESPHLRSKATGLRLESLLDRLAEQRYEPIREVLVKMLAFSVWREHPGVIKIRAVFGSLNLPRAEEFERGKRESYDFLYAYDFSRAEEPAKAENH